MGAWSPSPRTPGSPQATLLNGSFCRQAPDASTEEPASQAYTPRGRVCSESTSQAYTPRGCVCSESTSQAYTPPGCVCCGSTSQAYTPRGRVCSGSTSQAYTPRGCVCCGSTSAPKITRPATAAGMRSERMTGGSSKGSGGGEATPLTENAGDGAQRGRAQGPAGRGRAVALWRPGGCGAHIPSSSGLASPPGLPFQINCGKLELGMVTLELTDNALMFRQQEKPKSGLRSQPLVEVKTRSFGLGGLAASRLRCSDSWQHMAPFAPLDDAADARPRRGPSSELMGDVHTCREHMRE